MTTPDTIRVRGARVHNLRHLDVDVPLGQLVGIAGVSGSGKSSLALGVLYAEGSRRYLEALSTYTRRRLSQAARADVDRVEHVPAALALRQRPGVPGVRSTFGTQTELLNVLRLMYSRLSSYLCPNGHRVPPTIDVAAEVPVFCPTCGAEVETMAAEDFAFNSRGACPTCSGTGIVRDVNDATLVPDASKTLDEGAVQPWQMFGFNVQPQIAHAMGVRTDVPWAALTDRERDIVLNGPEEKRHITVTTRNGVHDLDFTFRNARLTVLKELERAADEKRLSRVSKFLTERTCPACGGSRLSPKARIPQIDGRNLAEVSALALDDLLVWALTVPSTRPASLRAMATTLVDTLESMAGRLVQLGLGYLALDRAASTLSTGERQRAQLARAVRNETTGVLYVLDEPSIGMHPSNVEGLIGVMRDLLVDGNSVVFVDHDVQVLREADHLIEIGPGSGTEGGEVIATGSVGQIIADPDSLIGGFLAGTEKVVVRPSVEADEVFSIGRIHLQTRPIHTVHALDVDLPTGRMTAVTGPSGSGKTTLILESLVPALQADDRSLPDHVRGVDRGGIERVRMVDASPIGVNVRSTVATYSSVMDDLRRLFAQTGDAKAAGLTASDFSYNTGSLRCPQCDGTGEISLDVQFLPDIDIECPTCHGSRYDPKASRHRRPLPSDLPKEKDRTSEQGSISMPEALRLTASQAAEAFADAPKVRKRLHGLIELGLGYLTLGEATPALSGGEAQRLKLSNELGRNQEGTLFVLDEPSVGLHPLDVQVLLRVLERLIDRDATVIVIEHDVDVIANSDWVIDMGPGGGASGGRIVATGTPPQVAHNPDSPTGPYLT